MFSVSVLRHLVCFAHGQETVCVNVDPLIHIDKAIDIRIPRVFALARLHDDEKRWLFPLTIMV